jgi:hypothetical protein
MIVASILALHLQENMQITPVAHIARKRGLPTESLGEHLATSQSFPGCKAFFKIQN